MLGLNEHTLIITGGTAGVGALFVSPGHSLYDLADPLKVLALNARREY